MSVSTEQIVLRTPDISCGHCVATVERAVGALSGVAAVQASAETKQVSVSFDPIQVSRSQIETALDNAGYPVSG
jgi:copper chaperone